MSNVGLIGASLKHSISKDLHMNAAGQFNLQLEYNLWEIESNIEKFIHKVRDSNILGFNITIPYKEKVISFLDELDPISEEIGSVNTVVNNNGKLIGYNTDLYGIQKSFELNNTNILDKKIFIIGSGGVAKTLIYYFIKNHAGQIIVVNRSASKFSSIKSFGNEIECLTFDDPKLSTVQLNADIIVNATPFGMKFSTLEGQLPPFHTSFNSNQLIFDLVYNPELTPLVLLANKMGSKTITGLGMLVYQAAKSFELWTNQFPNEEEMLIEGRKILSNNEGNF
jgi:shikimate dehydrogenase